jgi:hypothetical protein
MVRALWAVPAAIVAWVLAGFGAWYAGGRPGATGDGRLTEVVPLAPAAVDVLAVGAVVAGVAAGLLLRRLRLAVPVTLAIGAGAWFLTRNALEQAGRPIDDTRAALITLLVGTGAGAILGALGQRRSELGAVAIALPVAWYALLPGRLLAGEVTAGRVEELNGMLVAIGCALLLYVACWRIGWRSMAVWPVVAASYLLSFAAVEGATAVAASRRTTTQLPAPEQADRAAESGMDAFFGAFGNYLERYWPWLAIAVFLAVMMVALKIRALPPKRPELKLDDRPNDAILPDDLDWFDQTEPRRRLIPRREPVG